MRAFRFWGELVFSDECSFWLNDNDHEGWFHNDADNPLSMDKHSGKIHAFAAISCLGKINLFTFKDNLNSERFATILRQQLIPQANRVHPFGWVLVEDNSPCHKGAAIEVLRKEVPYVLEWPSKFPDLNPIENLWALLKREVRKALPKTLNDLERAIHRAWNSLDVKTVENLASSFRFRVMTCYNRNGHKVNY